MSEVSHQTISVFRDYNRFYTRVIGLLDRYLLQSAFNLGEARVMYEISQQDGLLIGDIQETLGMDKGYLSRILDRFRRERLIQKTKSILDARATHVFLTAKGRQVFQTLDWAANKQIKDMIADLSEEQIKELITHMTKMQAILSTAKVLTNPPKKMGTPTFRASLMMTGNNAGSTAIDNRGAVVSGPGGADAGDRGANGQDAGGNGASRPGQGAPAKVSRPSKKNPINQDPVPLLGGNITTEDGFALTNKLDMEDITIRTELRSGDLGYLVYLHGHLYGIEYQYGIGFESYVAQGIHEFYQQYDPVKDRVWICEHRGRIVGSLVLMHRKADTAQLRYFIVEPGYRKLGLGKRLMLLFMDHLKKAGYAKAYLWTTEDLSRASALYRKNGFYLTETKLNSSFGSMVVEQRYDLTMRFANLR